MTTDNNDGCLKIDDKHQQSPNQEEEVRGSPHLEKSSYTQGESLQILPHLIQLFRIEKDTGAG